MIYLTKYAHFQANGIDGVGNRIAAQNATYRCISPCNGRLLAASGTGGGRRGRRPRRGRTTKTEWTGKKGDGQGRASRDGWNLHSSRQGMWQGGRAAAGWRGLLPAAYRGRGPAGKSDPSAVSLRQPSGGAASAGGAGSCCASGPRDGRRTGCLPGDPFRAGCTRLSVPTPSAAAACRRNRGR